MRPLNISITERWQSCVPFSRLISARNSSNTAFAICFDCADPVSSFTATGVPLQVAFHTWPNPPPPITSSNFNSSNRILDCNDSEASVSIVRFDRLWIILFLGSPLGIEISEPALEDSSAKLGLAGGLASLPDPLSGASTSTPTRQCWELPLSICTNFNSSISIDVGGETFPEA